MTHALESAGECPECGAHYNDAGDSCAARFNQLLALDHSRREPWGSRHGQAFAAYALSHPAAYPSSLDSTWLLLYRIYVSGEAPRDVIASLRAAGGQVPDPASIASRAPRRLSLPAITIADLGDFAAGAYPAQLDDWCRAVLDSWGAPVRA